MRWQIFLVAMVMSSMTASLRFPGKLNGDLRKMGLSVALLGRRRECPSS